MQIPSEAEILENLSPCYRLLFKDIQRQKIYSGEQLVYAADFTGNNGYSSVMAWGFIIFTDRRYLKVHTLSNGTSGISYYKSGSNWDKIKGKKVDDRRWFDPYKSYNERFLEKLRLPDCWDFEYSTIRGIVKNDYSISYSSQNIELVELRLEFSNRSGDIYKTFKLKDGEFIFNLLNLAIQNHGKISSQASAYSEKDSNRDI